VKYGFGTLVDCYWQGKCKYSERNIFRWHFFHYKSHMDRSEDACVYV